MIALIQSVLSPDLLSPQWRKMVTPKDHTTKGHCYAASEALYHLYAKEQGYFPCVLRIGPGLTHWFLRDSSGSVLDPTAEQFSETPNYASGKRCGFLTGSKPSKRAKVIMYRTESKRQRIRKQRDVTRYELRRIKQGRAS